MASIQKTVGDMFVNPVAPDKLPGVQIPIRLKIILPYLMLAILLAVGAAYLITQIVFDSLEERFTNQLIESGKLASEWVYREEERMLASLRLLTNASGVPDAIQNRQAERLRELTFGIVVDNREEAVEVLDTSGYLLLSMRHIPGGNIEEYNFVKEGDRSFMDWEFVSKVVNNNPDGFSDKYSGLAETDDGEYFYIASPVLDSAGAQVGTVLVGKRLATITRQVREETLAQVTLYRFSGTAIKSTFSQPADLQGTFASEVIGNQDKGSLSRSQRDLQVSNLNYQEIIGPWEVRDNADIGLLGVALPKTFYVQPDRVTRIQIILLVGMSLFLIVVLGIGLSRVITQPLISLVRASVQVSRGDLQVQLKPQSNDEVAVLTQAFNQMVTNLKESRNAILNAYDSTLEGWSKALEMRDKETEGHTMRVTKMAIDLARVLGIDEEELVNIQHGALLHDIGKMGIPDTILLKPGPLTNEEWEIMRKHPQFAFEMLWPIEYLRSAIDIPYYHHERWNGSGYPKGLQGEEIPYAARIFAVVDVWDALTSDRVYKNAMDPIDAIAEIKAQRGILFDPCVVDAFLIYISNSGEAKP